MDKKLLYKPDMKPYTIWDVKCKKTGFPYFLIYRNSQWVYRSAKLFTPDYYESWDGSYQIDS